MKCDWQSTIFHKSFLTQLRNQLSPECLYVFNQYGKLSEFSLDARGAKQHTRITDESPLEVRIQTTYILNFIRIKMPQLNFRSLQTPFVNGIFNG